MSEKIKISQLLEKSESIKQVLSVSILEQEDLISYNKTASNRCLLAILFIWIAVSVFFAAFSFSKMFESINDNIVIAVLLASTFLTITIINQRKQHESNVINLNYNKMNFYRLALCMDERDTEKLPAIREALLKDLFASNNMPKDKMWDLFKEHPMYEIGEKILERVNIDISKKN